MICLMVLCLISQVNNYLKLWDRYLNISTVLYFVGIAIVLPCKSIMMYVCMASLHGQSVSVIISNLNDHRNPI